MGAVQACQAMAPHQVLQPALLVGTLAILLVPAEYPHCMPASPSPAAFPAMALSGISRHSQHNSKCELMEVHVSACEA